MRGVISKFGPVLLLMAIGVVFMVSCNYDDPEPEPEPKYDLILEVHPAGAGILIGAGEYHEGEQVNISATAEGNWGFLVWSGDTDQVDDPRGLCPDGWHVPSHYEWTQLEQYICNALGNSNCETHYPFDHSAWGARGTNEGNALMSCRQVGSPLDGCNTSEQPRWNSSDFNYGFDELGFSALPGGVRYTQGFFYGVGSHGSWWSSSKYSSTLAWYRSMSNISNIYGGVMRDSSGRRVGYSVHLVRD